MVSTEIHSPVEEKSPINIGKKNQNFSFKPLQTVN